MTIRKSAQYLLLLCSLAILLTGCAGTATDGSKASESPSPTAFDTGGWDITTPFLGTTLGMSSAEARDLFGEPDDEFTTFLGPVLQYDDITMFGRPGTVYLKFDSEDSLNICRWESIFYYNADKEARYKAMDFYSSMLKTMKQKAGDPDAVSDDSNRFFTYDWQMDGYYVELSMALTGKEYNVGIEYFVGELDAE